jgi:hypothetical protein
MEVVMKGDLDQLFQTIIVGQRLGIATDDGAN